MSGEIQFRSSVFGGFNKSDVIDYIEKLQALHNGLRDGFQTQNNELSKALVYVKQLEERLMALNLENKELKEKSREYSQKFTDDTEKSTGEKSGKPSDIDIGCDRLKKVESQIGALLLDAVIYSDRMTEEAKEAAKNITSDAKNTIITTVEDVNRLGVEICMLSENFSDTLSKMIDKVEDLSKNLTVFASKFDKDLPDGPELPAASERSEFVHHIEEFNRSVDNGATKDTQRVDKELPQEPSSEDSEKGFILSFERYNDGIEEESLTELNDAPDGETHSDVDREIMETMQSDEEENELIESLMETHMEDEYDDTTVLSSNEPETINEADEIIVEEPDADLVEETEEEAAVPEDEEEPDSGPAETINEADETIIEVPDAEPVEDTEEDAVILENEEEPESEPAETINEADEIVVEEPDAEPVEDTEETPVPEDDEDDDSPEDVENSESEHKKEYMRILEKKPLIDERLKIPTSQEIEELIGFFSGNK